MRTVFTILVLLSARQALCCECVLPSVSAEVKRSEVVFRGVVTEITDSQITFAVQRVFKGRLPASFKMPKLILTADCSPGFRPTLVKVGNMLLVYAWRADFFPEGLLTSTCSRTTLASKATEDFKKLGYGRSPTAVGRH